MSYFYPSPPLWLKRITMASIICTTGICILMNDIEHRVIMEIKSISEDIDSLIPYANRASRVMTLAVPLIEKIETWGFEEYVNSDAVKNRISTIEKLDKQNATYSTSLNLLLAIISFLGIFMWLPIIGASFWLYKDLTEGDYKVITLIHILSAIGFSIWSHKYLDIIIADLLDVV